MKILFLIFSPRLSGAEIAILRLLEKINSDNYYVLCNKEDISFVKNFVNKAQIITSQSVDILDRDNKLFIKTIFRLVKIVFGLNINLFSLYNKFNFDLIYANNNVLAFYILPTVLLNRIFRRKSLKFIWHDHNLKSNSRIINYFEVLSQKIFNQTIVCSLVVENKYSCQNVKLLYNGIDTTQFIFNQKAREAIRKYLNINDEIVIGIFGVISVEKGHQLLIQVFNKILEIHPKIKLIIVGKASSTNYLGSLKIENNSNIELVKWTEDIISYYNAIDILVSASHNESFGLTIIEAMACEKIVLCSNTGGIPEIIKNNQNGYLFDPSNIHDLYVKLLFIIDNILEMKNIRKMARQSIIKRFEISIMERNFNNILSLLNENT